MTWENVRMWFGLAVVALGAWWVGLGVVLQVLLVLMGLDLATGMAAAFVARNLDSGVGWRGVVRKALTLAVVAVGNSIEPLIASGLGSPGLNIPLGEAVCLYFAAVESLSVCENAVRAGVPVPRVLRDALVKLKAVGGDEPPAPAVPHG